MQGWTWIIQISSSIMRNVIPLNLLIRNIGIIYLFRDWKESVHAPVLLCVRTILWRTVGNILCRILCDHRLPIISLGLEEIIIEVFLIHQEVHQHKFVQSTVGRSGLIINNSRFHICIVQMIVGHILPGRSIYILT